jgi:hypothetical protein
MQALQMGLSRYDLLTSPNIGHISYQNEGKVRRSTKSNVLGKGKARIMLRRRQTLLRMQSKKLVARIHEGGSAKRVQQWLMYPKQAPSRHD